ncbi:hypothetical protein GIW81_00920 [Hyphomicrobium sp. xq]|uniref:Deoxynucleotide monophosphate kinase n=1 Tax=Hyphomicrobium album TaxID=2665159 RepID=A0A6I3KFW7_9HYPH|nr:hypothetical protein [Hyphomicrobium album]MTD92890.1 hypothetical protein [Hyphomicrobium album]
MDPFNVIGLYSPAPASGKTTSAKYLQNEFNLVQASFSNPMKLMLLKFVLNFAPLGLASTAAYSWANQYFENKNLPIREIPGTPTMRHLLDTLGTTWGRTAVHEDVWVEAARARVNQMRAKGMQGVVFDDVRFQNEADMLRELGGQFVKIVMPGNEASGLQSEGNLEGFPFAAEILNGGDKGALFKVITEVVRPLLGGR